MFPQHPRQLLQRRTEAKRRSGIGWGLCPWRGKPDVSSSEFSGAHTWATQNSRVLCPKTEDFFSAELQKPVNSYGLDSFLQLGFSVLSAFWPLRLKRAINSKAFPVYTCSPGAEANSSELASFSKNFKSLFPGCIRVAQNNSDNYDLLWTFPSTWGWGSLSPQWMSHSNLFVQWGSENKLISPPHMSNNVTHT